ncbi:large ribosomal subunit protein mL101 (rPPR4)-like isoform X2 [Wolffia australiana]
MEWMDTKGIHMTQSNHAIRIDLLSKTTGIDSAEGYFSNLPESAKNYLTYGSLLNCYCKQKKVEKATNLYENMKILGFDSNTLVYNNLGSLYLKLEQPQKIPPLIEQMKAKNIPLDTFTHCILMNAFARLGDVGAAENVVSEMGRDTGGAPLPWPVYSNLASIYISAGLTLKAESALKMLEMAIDRKDRNSLHFLISLHAQMGNVSEVNRVWRLMKGIFPKTTNLSYLVVLQALDRLDDVGSMKICYEEWQDQTMHHDIRLTNVMIGVYLRKNMVGDALYLWEAASRKGSEPNIKTFDLFVDYYLKNQEMEQAVKCVLTAAKKTKMEWRMDEKKVGIFLKYFEDKKDLEGYRRFQDALRKLTHS